MFHQLAANIHKPLIFLEVDLKLVRITVKDRNISSELWEIQRYPLHRNKMKVLKTSELPVNITEMNLSVLL